jgi:hypothetical protein
MTTLPSVLGIHVRRQKLGPMDSNGELTTLKIVNKVILPSELTLTIVGTEVRYDLQSAAYHRRKETNAQDGGHYYAKGTHGSQYFVANDSVVGSAPFRTCRTIILRYPFYVRQPVEPRVPDQDKPHKSSAEITPRQRPRLMLRRAYSERCSDPRATQRRSGISRSLSVGDKRGDSAKSSAKASQDGGEIVPRGISASAQPTAKTKVRGAERPPQERLSPKSSGSQPKNRKAKVYRESKPMVWLREGNIARVGVNAETRLIAAVRPLLDRNNAEMLNSIGDKVLAELGVTKERACTDDNLNRTVRDRTIRAIMEYAKEAAGLSTADEISEAVHGTRIIIYGERHIFVLKTEHLVGINSA